MSEDMPSWRYLNSASSRISSFKGYLQTASGRPHPAPNTNTQKNERGNWRAWAGQKMKLRRGTNDGSKSSEVETLSLFPGWAVRRYRKIGSNELGEAFEVEVFVSGFATSCRSPETASRSQRAFIHLAKGFASLPKLTADAIDPEPYEPLRHLSPSTEALLAQKKLPPRPTEIPENYDIETLERQFRRANNVDTHDSTRPGSSRSSSVDPEEVTPEITLPLPPEPQINDSVAALSASALRKLHANLESRLRPFWSSVLPGRTIQLKLFASPHYTPPSGPLRTNSEVDGEAEDYGPIASQEVLTFADGSFQARFTVKWEDLCTHPRSLHIAFGDRYEEHDLLVAARLLPVPATPPSSASSESSESEIYTSKTQVTPPSIIPEKSIRISITCSPIRVISDIDDTVKLSNVIRGARVVFHNVFVKDLQENVIPGMGEWYTNMWNRGIRFHYVSNGPFELLPVLDEFLKISQLPPGSIKLKSYAGRSIFNGLLSAPATRKRAGVVDILDAFPESRFFLIGDTGEQDLELYADLARERSNQILAVLVRDVETGDPIDDPTGWKAIGASGTRPTPLVSSGSTDDTIRPRRKWSDLLSNKSFASTMKPTPLTSPTPRKEMEGGEYFNRSNLTAEPEQIESNFLPTPDTNQDTPKVGSTAPPSSADSFPQFISYPATPSDASFISKSSVSSTSSSVSRMPEPEKRRHMLQARVYIARTQMPGHIPLRVFREPSNCVEVEEILAKEAQPK